MIPQNLRAFVRDITKATSSGDLEWRERDHFGREVYVCSKNGYQLQIGSQWSDDTESMSITFSIQMPDSGLASFSTNQWEDDYQEMRVLFELATVAAAKINPDSLKGFFG